MNTIKTVNSISIEPLVFEAIMPFQLGIVQGKVRNGKTRESLLAEISAQCRILEKQLSLDEVRELERVKAIREAYKLLGNDPNRYRPAADALLRRIVKGKGLYSISAVVDTLNMVSVRYGISISGFDAQKIRGNVQLGKGSLNEPYEGIGRGDLNIANLPVLRDEVGAFGNPTSDSVRTAINIDTEHILFVYYNFGHADDLQQILIESCQLLETHAEAQQLQTKILQLSH